MFLPFNTNSKHIWQPRHSKALLSLAFAKMEGAQRTTTSLIGEHGLPFLSCPDPSSASLHPHNCTWSSTRSSTWRTTTYIALRNWTGTRNPQWLLEVSTVAPPPRALPPTVTATHHRSLSTMMRMDTMVSMAMNRMARMGKAEQPQRILSVLLH